MALSAANASNVTVNFYGISGVSTGGSLRVPASTQLYCQSRQCRHGVAQFAKSQLDIFATGNHLNPQSLFDSSGLDQHVVSGAIISVGDVDLLAPAVAEMAALSLRCPCQARRRATSLLTVAAATLAQAVAPAATVATFILLLPAVKLASRAASMYQAAAAVVGAAPVVQAATPDLSDFLAHLKSRLAVASRPGGGGGGNNGVGGGSFGGGGGGLNGAAGGGGYFAGLSNGSGGGFGSASAQLGVNFGTGSGNVGQSGTGGSVEGAGGAISISGSSILVSGNVGSFYQPTPMPGVLPRHSLPVYPATQTGSGFI